MPKPIYPLHHPPPRMDRDGHVIALVYGSLPRPLPVRRQGWLALAAIVARAMVTIADTAVGQRGLTIALDLVGLIPCAAPLGKARSSGNSTNQISFTWAKSDQSVKVGRGAAIEGMATMQLLATVDAGGLKETST